MTRDPRDRTTPEERRRIRERIQREELEQEAERQELAGACPLCGAPELLISGRPTCSCLSELAQEQLR